MQQISRKALLKIRLRYLLATITIIILGLLSRRIASHIPAFINTYLGDALWAMMIYGMARIILTQSKLTTIFIASLLFCYAIELSQLCHAPWIDSVRHTRLGGLVLGFGFLWTDIMAYTIGIIIACLSDRLYRRNMLQTITS